MMVKNVRHLLLLVFFLSILPAGCNGKKDEGFTRGEGLQIEVEGIRGLVERVIAASESRILVAGASGRDLEGRLLWGDRNGAVLQDLTFEQIRQPRQMAACVEGTNGLALFVTDQDGIDRVHQVVVIDDQFQPWRQDAQWIGAEGGPIQLSALDDVGHGCGICAYRQAAGQLRCQLGLRDGSARTWTTGLLGHWNVMWVGEALVLADWSINEEGWIAVRMGHLDLSAEERPFEWLRGYRVGGLPPLVRDESQRELQPRFIPLPDRVAVVFIDGTEWFTRIFFQQFPLDSTDVSVPVELESCRGTCGVTWAGYLDGLTWVWYGDRSGAWAEWIAGDGTRSRLRFNPPRDVVPVGSGLFKMGLGNTVANWWAVLAHQ